MMQLRKNIFDAPPGSEAFKLDEKCLKTIKGLPARETDDTSGDRDRRWLRCAHCGRRIARNADRMSVNGRFAHVFNNPAGYVFEVGCFAMAEGCVNEGHPTMEFTWFAGFSWRLAVCGACRSHLGWFFQSMKGASFYGLILANLSESSR